MNTHKELSALRQRDVAKERVGRDWMCPTLERVNPSCGYKQVHGVSNWRQMVTFFRPQRDRIRSSGEYKWKRSRDAWGRFPDVVGHMARAGGRGGARCQSRAQGGTVEAVAQTDIHSHPPASAAPLYN